MKRRNLRVRAADDVTAILFDRRGAPEDCPRGGRTETNDQCRAEQLELAFEPLMTRADLQLKCLTALVTYVALRSIATSVSARSRSLPAGPTNGSPLRSSWSPGCSPTSTTRARCEPAPNTV